MDPNELMQQARDALTVKRVFGEPYERDGVTVIPAASIRGGAGGGRGEGAAPDGGGSGSGSGGGFGLTAKPAGVYVIDGTRCAGNRPSMSTGSSSAARSSRSSCCS